MDNYTAYFELLVLFAAAMTALMSLEYAADAGLAGAEYYALMLFAALGMMLMAAAGDLIVIFLGLETMSIAVYALAGFLRRDPRSNEAALKYFLLGAFSTGFLLYGIALIYGATGTIKLEPIERRAHASGDRQSAAAARRRPAADRLRLQGRRRALPYVDARRLRGRADAGHGVHGGRGQDRRVRRLRAHLHGPSGAAQRRSGRWCCG